MKIKNKSILFLFIVSLVLISLSLSAEANLSSIYESPAATEGSSAVKPTDSVKPAKTAQALKTNTPVTNQTTNGSVVATFVISKKYLDAINKEHARFCKAAVDAEMGLRYFFKTGYDASRGKKAPSEEQIKAMRFEIQLLMRDLKSSAKRYARNIAFARVAIDSMSEEERTFFTVMLKYIIASPAFADGQNLSSSMTGLENSLNGLGVQSGTVDVGINNLSPSDFSKIPDAMPESASAWENFASSKVAQVGAAGAKLVAGTVLTIGTIYGGCVLLGTAPVVGGVMVVGGILAGGFEFVSATTGFVDAAYGKETNKKDKNTKAIDDLATLTSLPLILVNPGKGVIEVSTTIVDGTKDFWVPWLTGTEDPKNPGKDGTKAVKKANDSNSGGGGSGGGGSGGGGSGGGGGGCGGGC